MPLLGKRFRVTYADGKRRGNRGKEKSQSRQLVSYITELVTKIVANEGRKPFYEVA